jgi:hypothetical protein
MVDLLVEPVPTDDLRPGELLSVRLRSLGETGAAEFIIDRDGDDAMVATNADGMTHPSPPGPDCPCRHHRCKS